jgi:hypothetical protein
MAQLVRDAAVPPLRNDRHKIPLFRLSLHLLVVGGLSLLLISGVSGAPRAQLWPRWQQHDAQNTQTVDHSSWDAFLRHYVVASHPSGVNRVRYAEVTPADRQILEAYLTRMQALPISTYNRREQLAYWMNLYNALTVALVVQHYPVESIRDIDVSGVFSDGPWKAKLLTVEGDSLSLDDIEHRILRPIWRDNRIHYAVNCASLGCPNLLPVAYTAANVEPLLDEGARAYVNHARGVSFEDGTLYVSSIYIWFNEDFDGDTDGILRHLQRYAHRDLATQLNQYRGRIKKRYDWRLNAP